MVFTILATLFLRFSYIRENRRRDNLVDTSDRNMRPPRSGSQEKLDEGGRDGYIVEKLSEYRDFTDKERKDFRYVY